VTPRASAPFTLYPHQLEARAAILAAWKRSPSCQFISACGTGKTVTMFALVGAVDASLVACFLPTLALVSQTNAAWHHQAGPAGINLVAVCSDATVGSATANSNSPAFMDELEISVDELGCEVVSNPTDLAAWLAKHPGTPERPTVVLSTYASAEHVVQAQESHGAPAFDVAFMDEAHHLVGEGKSVPAGERVKAKLDGQFRLLANRRVYATATPKTATRAVKNRIASGRRKDYPDFMDDTSEVYGPYAYTLSFGQAIARGILVDYTVSVIAVTESEMATIVADNDNVTDANGETVSAQFIVAREAIRRAYAGGARRFLTFQNRVSSSAKLARFLHESPDVPSAGHVFGKQSSSKRDEVIRQLGVTADGFIVTNVRCLSEVVDVPSLDVVVFIDPKHSPIEVIQGIGRCLRRDDANGKVVGHVILIVIVPESLNDETLSEDDRNSIMAAHEAFAPVFAVLSALEQHDEVVKAYMSELRVTGTVRRSKSRKRITDSDKAVRGDFLHVYDFSGQPSIYAARLAKNIELIAARKASPPRQREDWEDWQHREYWLTYYVEEKGMTFDQAAEKYDGAVSAVVAAGAV
jgi:predicted helicase